MSRQKSNKLYYQWIGICILLLVGLQFFQSNPVWVERIYSRNIYPFYSYLPKILFGWIRFSVGDLFYALIFLGFSCLLIKIILLLFRKEFSNAVNQFLKFTALFVTVYLFFYIAWAMNYYRMPIYKQLDIPVDTILLEDHLNVLDLHINKANSVRANLEILKQKRAVADSDIQDIMVNDTIFKMLTKTQVRIKSPVIGVLASYFGVSGYFNPFSNEAHINKDMPLTSYPFTVAHELSHQMGIGFEDECNFIAFVKLQNQSNPWYQYAAYYESVSYLLRTLYYVDSNLFEKYKSKLSSQVLADIKQDQFYWQQYSGWISDVSGMFYNQYLKHNNQAEGMARYGLVSRLIISWEQKKINKL